MNNKSLLEKIGNWIGITASIFAILGISVWGGISLIKDESKQEETRTIEEESVFLANSDYENDSLNIPNTISNQE